MRSTACLVRACEQLADPPAGSNSQTWGRPYLFFLFCGIYRMITWETGGVVGLGHGINPFGLCV